MLCHAMPCYAMKVRQLAACVPTTGPLQGVYGLSARQFKFGVHCDTGYVWEEGAYAMLCYAMLCYAMLCYGRRVRRCQGHPTVAPARCACAEQSPSRAAGPKMYAVRWLNRSSWDAKGFDSMRPVTLYAVPARSESAAALDARHPPPAPWQAGRWSLPYVSEAAWHLTSFGSTEELLRKLTSFGAAIA